MLKSTRSRVIAGTATMMAMVGGLTMFMLSGPTVHQVPVGASVQEYINKALPGDTIVLQSGGVYNANLTLPVKSGEGVITIQSSRAVDLPVGERVGPSQAPLLAKLQSTVNGEPVIKTVAAAKGYKFIGVEITTATASVAVFDLVKWGEDRRTQTTLASVPSNLSLDRSWVHGWPTQNVQRGVAINCASCEVTNSYVSDIHWVGQDSQAIGGWNGTNTARVINNYLEGAGENLMIGGADAAIAEMMPANIEIRNNYLFKPLTWKVGHPTYAGIHWTIKNLLEIKMGRNIIIDGNVLENSWADGQIGYAVLFTVRNQDGNNPWATIENAPFTNNIVKNSEQGIQLLGTDNLKPSGQASGLPIHNNLFINITSRFLTMSGGYKNVTLDHNTHWQGGNIMTLAGTAAPGFKYTNNITARMPSGFGIKGDGVEEGMPTLTKYTPDHQTTGNVIAMVATLTRFYPTGNFYPVTQADIGVGPDSRLLPTSAFKGKATDGTDPGVDMNKLEAAQSGKNPTPSPTATATIAPSPSPTPSVALPSPTATATPTGTPTPGPLPTATATPVPQPSPCQATAWPASANGQNSKMDERRAQGCYPFRRTGNSMEYTRP